MTVVADPPTEPATPAQPPPPPPPPLRPINLGAALIIAVLLIYNVHADAASTDYDGAYVTYGLIGGMCLALGLDVSKIWRGRDR